MPGFAVRYRHCQTRCDHGGIDEHRRLHGGVVLLCTSTVSGTMTGALVARIGECGGGECCQEDQCEFFHDDVLDK